MAGKQTKCWLPYCEGEPTHTATINSWTGLGPKLTTVRVCCRHQGHIRAACSEPGPQPKRKAVKRGK